MTHVATFISHPARPALATAQLEAMAELLPEASPPCWLDEGIAADIFFKPLSADLYSLIAALREKIGKAPVDVIVQPMALRRKRLLVADMDSTMIQEECLDELADCIGMKPVFAKITEAAMRGDIAFEPALRRRMELLAGLDVAAIDKVLDERLTPTPGGRTLVATMRAHGAVTALVSSGLTAFTVPIAARLGFDHAFGNHPIVQNGRFSGRISEPILGQAAKRAALEDLRAECGISQAETLAVGDGANDLDMLQAAALGIAYHAKPMVAAAAAARVDYADLTALLYAQGFVRQEFSE